MLVGLFDQAGASQGLVRCESGVEERGLEDSFLVSGRVDDHSMFDEARGTVSLGDIDTSRDHSRDGVQASRIDPSPCAHALGV